MKARPSLRQLTLRGAGSPSRKRAGLPQQRAGDHHQRAILADALDDGRRRAALVEDPQRLIDDAAAQQPEPRVDGEDVEAVVGIGAGCHDVEDLLARAADAPAEALVDVPGELLGADPSSSSLPTQ